MIKALNEKWASAGIVLGALMSAPCFVGIMLIPLGLGAVMSSTAFVWLDEFRYLFMLLTGAMLVVLHIGLRQARDFRPTRVVWVITIIAVLLVVGELAVDPPWARHANVPM